MDRMNKYRDMTYAQYIANKTCGEFIDKTFADEFGKYWIVIWRD